MLTRWQWRTAISVQRGLAPSAVTADAGPLGHCPRGDGTATADTVLLPHLRGCWGRWTRPDLAMQDTLPGHAQRRPMDAARVSHVIPRSALRAYMLWSERLCFRDHGSDQPPDSPARLRRDSLVSHPRDGPRRAPGDVVR